MRIHRTTLTTVSVIMGVLLASTVAADAKEPSQPTVRIAGVVLKWIRGDKATNYERAESMIREAAAGGAKIVCTTECFLDGYAIADKSIPLDTYRALGETIPNGPYFQKLSRLAAELHVYLIVGMLEADGDTRMSSAVSASEERTF
jgi:predicted amidohydrolase